MGKFWEDAVKGVVGGFLVICLEGSLVATFFFVVNTFLLIVKQSSIVFGQIWEALHMPRRQGGLACVGAAREVLVRVQREIVVVVIPWCS